jgi:Uma2 family endonuclease
MLFAHVRHLIREISAPAERNTAMGVPLQKISLADYLAWEDGQAGRNEFWRGEVFAMVGGKRGHGRVVANLMRHLGNHLDGSPCQVFSENMKVQVGQDAVLYPDVFVTYDREFTAEQPVFTAPVLIIEVLSPSTNSPSTGNLRHSRNMGSSTPRPCVSRSSGRVTMVCGTCWT